MNTERQQQDRQKEERVGAIVGSIIIVVVLLAGAIYFTMTERDVEIKKQQAQEIEQNNQATTTLQYIQNQLSAPEPDYVNELK